MEFKIYLIAAIILLIGGLNWGLIGLFGVNGVEAINNYTFQSVLFEQVVYILVGLASIYMMFNRTYYLPFLGKTVMPNGIVTEYQTSSPTAKTFTINQHLEGGSHVIVWAALSKKNSDVTDYLQAYGDYSNYAVAKIVNNSAIVKLDCPQEYYVDKFGVKRSVLSKHLHYRVVYNNGIFSDIKTQDVVC
jgi:uncharacterized membrane protein YuzA (DUF378 family)